jgi:hypothetical protein
MLFLGFGLQLWGCDRLKEPAKPIPAFKLLVSDDRVELTSADTFGVEVNILGNDLVSDTAYVQIVSSAAFGVLKSLNGRSELFYIPKKYYSGYDTASYRVCIGDSCQKAWIYFTVKDTLEIAQITANADSLEITEGSTVYLDILKNDKLKGNSVFINTFPAQSMLGNKVGLKFEYPKFPANPTRVQFVEYRFGYEIVASQINRSFSEVKIKIIPDCDGRRFQAHNDTIAGVLNYSAFTKNLLENDSICSDDRNRVSIKLIRGTSYGRLSFDPLLFSYTTDQIVLDSFEYEICNPVSCRRAKAYFKP